jgi:NAD(P)-dependent dehydrogenase (short-subunit alcohol dehydrogenase family)
MNPDISIDLSKSPYGLAGKTILVTGASSGIGRAVASRCAEAGACVVATGRDAVRLGQTVAALPGPDHRTLPADLTDPAALRALADGCGPLDGVVHSAGVRGLSPIRMAGEKFVRHVMQINYEVPVLLTQRLLHKNVLRDNSSMIFMSSIAAHIGTTGVGIYSGSKAALVGTMRCLALEVAKRGMRANCLCPGLVETNLITEDPTWFEGQKLRYPLGIGMPDDVAFACIYLLSDASRKVTGIEFNMDGGVLF